MNYWLFVESVDKIIEDLLSPLIGLIVKDPVNFSNLTKNAVNAKINKLLTNLKLMHVITGVKYDLKLTVNTKPDGKMYFDSYFVDIEPTRN